MESVDNSSTYLHPLMLMIPLVPLQPEALSFGAVSRVTFFASAEKSARSGLDARFLKAAGSTPGRRARHFTFEFETRRAALAVVRRDSLLTHPPTNEL